MNFVDYLFENARDPNAPFLKGKDECNYGKLISDVEQLSSGLSKVLGRGKEVLLLSDNGMFFITCYLAIMKSRNIAMLIDPRTDEGQIFDVFGDDRPEACFVQSKYWDSFPKIRRWHEDDLPSLKSNDAIIGGTTGDELAVVVFTSGSTGSKKGVMITHANLIANTSSIVEYLSLTSNDRALLALPLHYCFGASILHTHIRVGGSLVLFDANFLGAVPDYIDQHSCTSFSGVPSTYQILLARTKFAKRAMPSLRYLTQAGGKLENAYIRQIYEAFPDKKFIVMYGATEATARMSYLPAEMLVKKMGSIGKGIPNVVLKVISDDGQEVTPGEVGEIVAKGDNIMRGYYKDPKGTSEVLRDGYYRTGDLATVDEDGFIYIVGRARDIIKSAGFRISPYEIENLICEMEGVASCAVVGTSDELMGEAVVAFLQPKAGTDPDVILAKVAAECKRRLPSYKVPQRIIIKHQMPTNSSNKVDKIALREELARGVKP